MCTRKEKTRIVEVRRKRKNRKKKSKKIKNRGAHFCLVEGTDGAVQWKRHTTS